jgi:hypothetical protein
MTARDPAQFKGRPGRTEHSEPRSGALDGARARAIVSPGGGA